MKKQDWQIDNIKSLSEILKIVYDDLTDFQKEKIRIKLWIYQDGYCPICNDRIELSKGNLDHNHITGYIRGLLCISCNNGLGCFEDNKHILKAAIKYLTNSMELKEVTITYAKTSM